LSYPFHAAAGGLFLALVGAVLPTRYRPVWGGDAAVFAFITLSVTFRLIPSILGQISQLSDLLYSSSNFFRQKANNLSSHTPRKPATLAVCCHTDL
jgi:hypothetical protein